MRRRLVLLLLLTPAAAGAAAPDPALETVVRVGIALSLTGRAATLALHQRGGYDLAAQRINEDGGAAGRRAADRHHPSRRRRHWPPRRDRGLHRLRLAVGRLCQLRGPLVRHLGRFS
jgi:hypothetical protein